MSTAFNERSGHVVTYDCQINATEDLVCYIDLNLLILYPHLTFNFSITFHHIRSLSSTNFDIQFKTLISSSFFFIFILSIKNLSIVTDSTSSGEYLYRCFVDTVYYLKMFEYVFKFFSQYYIVTTKIGGSG